jgi:polynucleotide 5'-hydroxyl-kinase GRC3/NOL9
MSQDWAEKTAQQLLGRDTLQRGTCLLLGGVDTGKTTLAVALAKRLADRQPVGIIDADIGQSHLGPPTTVGWAVISNPQIDLSQLTATGIAFIGDITPVGHLLQLTAAIVGGVQQLSKVTDIIIVDTPGLIRGSAAAALWWTVHRILQPVLILAVQRSDELSDILAGLRTFGCSIERIICPAEIPAKSPAERCRYRQTQFDRYFRNSCLYSISVSEVAVQSSRRLSRESLLSRLVGLRDENSVDIAVGVVTDVQQGGNVVVVRAPRLDVRQVRCLVVGDVTVDIAEAPR